MIRESLLRFLLISITAPAVSCSGTLERIKKDEITYVVTVPHGGPLIYQKELELVGLDAEIAKRIVDRIGRVEIGPGQAADIKLHWISRSYGTWIAALENEEADLGLAILGITEEAKQHIQFSDPYYTSQLVLIINPTYRRDIQGTDQLNGVTIGVREFTAVQNFVEKQFPDSTIAAFKTLDDAVLAIRRGEVDALIDDRNMTAYSLDTVPGVSHLEVLPGIVGRIDCGVSMRKGEDDLLKLVDEVIADSKAEGQIDQWIDEHVGDRVSRVESRHLKRVESDRHAARPRRISIRVSKAANFDFDIYRLANLSFVLTEQETEKSYRSSRIAFSQKVAVSTATIPPGNYVLTLRKFRLKAPVVIEGDDPSDVTVKIRLRRGAVDVVKS